MPNQQSSERPELAVTRVRHPLKMRLLQVTRVTPITPHLVRITLAGDDLLGFESSSFDDHLKVFFPADGAEKPVLPAGPPGVGNVPGTPRPVARDFTPRRYDPATGELALEFVLHDAGPATTWASRAQIGHYLGIGGPRGSMIIPTSFDWHLLIGDETALPAIARRLEELPGGVNAIVVAEVAGAYAQVDFKSRAAMHVTWSHRTGSAESGLVAALRKVPALPAGEGYAWAAAEAGIVRQVREHLVVDRGIDKSRIRAAAYWKRGLEAVHEVIDD